MCRRLNWAARIREITSWLMQCLVRTSILASQPLDLVLVKVFFVSKHRLRSLRFVRMSLATKQTGHQSIFFVYFSLLLSWWFRISRLRVLLVNLVCPALNVDGPSSSTCSPWNHLIQYSDQNSNVTGMLRKFCIFS